MFLKAIIAVITAVFAVSALFGLVGFLMDIVRYPMSHEKVKVIPSSEMPDKDEVEEAEDGLILDNEISIFGGDSLESDN